MKRALDSLDDDDCDYVYQNLEIDQKRAALRSVFKDTETILICADTAQFRDILKVMVRFVDLQTWGRLHRVCKVFNAHIPQLPDLMTLEKHFSSVTVTKGQLAKWTVDCRNVRKLCVRYHKACIRRVLQTAHALRSSFLFELSMKNASQKLPFGKRAYKVQYPYGHIVRNPLSPVGNIFTNDWRSLLRVDYSEGILCFSTYREMSQEEKKHCDQQKAQLKHMPYF